MHIEALVNTLKTLKLYGMMNTVQELAIQNSPAYQQAVPILEVLLKSEVSDREVRSIAYQMKSARFPTYRDLYGFDFSERSRAYRSTNESTNYSRYRERIG